MLFGLLISFFFFFIKPFNYLSIQLDATSFFARVGDIHQIFSSVFDICSFLINAAKIDMKKTKFQFYVVRFTAKSYDSTTVLSQGSAYGINPVLHIRVFQKSVKVSNTIIKLYIIKFIYNKIISVHSILRTERLDPHTSKTTRPFIFIIIVISFDFCLTFNSSQPET